MAKVWRMVIDAVAEGILYDLVCHLVPALAVYGILSGTPARFVNALGKHLNGTAVAYERSEGGE